jgi:predicted dehydrogenase
MAASRSGLLESAIWGFATSASAFCRAPEPRAIHHDYRDLITRKDVDAILIVTPEHLHHRMAMDALEADKDVYLEKPMTYTIAEAKELEQA